MITARSTTIHHPQGPPPGANGSPGLAGMPPGAISTSPYSAVIHHPMDHSTPGVTGGSIPYYPPDTQPPQLAPSAIPGAPSELLQLLARAAVLVARMDASARMDAAPATASQAPQPGRIDLGDWIAALEIRVGLLEATLRPTPTPEPVAKTAADEGG
jgi:hypothetical protein